MRPRRADADADGIVERHRREQEDRKPPAARQRAPLSGRQFPDELERRADEEAAVEKETGQREPRAPERLAARKPEHREDDGKEDKEAELDEQHEMRSARGVGRLFD